MRSSTTHSRQVLVPPAGRLKFTFQPERPAMSYRFYQTLEGGTVPRDLTLAAVMTPAPHTLAPQQLVRDALFLMREAGIRHVPIAIPAADRPPHLAGLVTETDVLQKVVHGKRLTEEEQYHAMLDLMLPLEQIMTRDVRTLTPETVVRDAATLMLEHRVRCVPVINAEGGVLGIVTQTDLLALLQHMLD